MAYEDIEFKRPVQSDDYAECSRFVIRKVDAIISAAIESGNNKIFINTNLRLGLPMENINKIAGPFVEAWASETFVLALSVGRNAFDLVNVEAQERLHKADIILQFRRRHLSGSAITAEVDVKATAQDIASSGKSPNITSFGRIRTAYVEDPDLIFLVLSLKHKVYSSRNAVSALMDGVMEVVSYNTYDLKHLSERDIRYNPALGTGQIQIPDIHYVNLVERDAWQFCQLLDRKFLACKSKSFDQWHALAARHGWIK